MENDRLLHGPKEDPKCRHRKHGHCKFAASLHYNQQVGVCSCTDCPVRDLTAAIAVGCDHRRAEPADCGCGSAFFCEHPEKTINGALEAQDCQTCELREVGSKPVQLHLAPQADWTEQEDPEVEIFDIPDDDELPDHWS